MAKFLSPDSRSDWKLGQRHWMSFGPALRRSWWWRFTHVALLKPTYSFPASLFMKFITCRGSKRIIRKVLFNAWHSDGGESHNHSHTHIIKFFSIACSLLRNKAKDFSDLKRTLRLTAARDVTVALVSTSGLNYYIYIKIHCNCSNQSWLQMNSGWRWRRWNKTISQGFVVSTRRVKLLRIKSNRLYLLCGK